MMDSIHCSHCEERLSDYAEGALAKDVQLVVEAHLSSCRSCGSLYADITGMMNAGREFPAYEAPAWLATRIVAQTRQTLPASFSDWLSMVWRSLAEPRIALAIFTAVIVIGWFGGVAERQAILNKAESLVGCTYDRAVRSYFRSPLIIEIQSRFDQLLENS